MASLPVEFPTVYGFYPVKKARGRRWLYFDGSGGDLGITPMKLSDGRSPGERVVAGRIGI